MAAIGSLMIPALIEAGYDKYFSVGLLTTAGSLGILIPPSITFILYGAVTGTSIGELFIAGFLPGIFFSILFMIYCYIHAKRRGHQPSSKPTTERGLDSLQGRFLGLGDACTDPRRHLYRGFYSNRGGCRGRGLWVCRRDSLSTENLGWKQVKEIFCSSGLLSASLLLDYGWRLFFFLAHRKPGTAHTDCLDRFSIFSQNPIWVLFLINILLLITGCFLDGASAVIILAPLLYSVVTKLGVDPVHFGVIMIVNMEVGMMTPPVGLNLFVGSGISKMPLMEVARAVIPTLLIMIGGLFFLTYVPEISLLLPKAVLWEIVDQVHESGFKLRQMIGRSRG